MQEESLEELLRFREGFKEVLEELEMYYDAEPFSEVSNFFKNSKLVML